MNRGAWQLIAEATFIVDPIGNTVSLAAGSWGVDADSLGYTVPGRLTARLSDFAAGDGGLESFVDQHFEASAWLDGNTGDPCAVFLGRPITPTDEFIMQVLALVGGTIVEAVPARVHLRAWRRAAT
jgi:hypothetical protein